MIDIISNYKYSKETANVKYAKFMECFVIYDSAYQHLCIIQPDNDNQIYALSVYVIFFQHAIE